MVEKLLFHLDADGIGVITFNRPQARNALDLEAMATFAALVDSLKAADNLRVLILTGAGTAAFCSGADLIEMSQRPTEADATDMIGRMGDALLALERLPVPVIAAMNGYALGGGAEVSMACDLRLIDEGGKLGFLQAKRGVVPGWGGGQRLLRLVGYARALDLLLRASILTPGELMALGLVNRITPMGEALSAAQELAQHITQLDPAVVRSMKALVQAGLTQPYEVALHTERALFPPLWVGEAQVKSMQEFLARSASKP